MAAKLMTARYAGVCRACAGPIAAGEQIVYAPRNVRHAACAQADRELDRPLNPWTNPMRTITLNSGARVTSRRYRCEDAPCCGCCD